MIGTEGAVASEETATPKFGLAITKVSLENDQTYGTKHQQSS